MTREYYVTGHSRRFYCSVLFYEIFVCLEHLTPRYRFTAKIQFFSMINPFLYLDDYYEQVYDTKSQYFYNHLIENEILNISLQKQNYFGDLIYHNSWCESKLRLHSIEDYIVNVFKEDLFDKIIRDWQLRIGVEKKFDNDRFSFIYKSIGKK